MTTAIARYPDDALTVVALANLDAGHARTGLITHVIAGLAAAPLLPPKLTAIDDAQPALAASLRTLLDRIAAGEDITDQVTPQFAKIITPESTKTVLQAVAPLWPGGTVTLVRRTTAPNDATRVVSTYRLTKSGHSLLVIYSVNPDGKVAALGFRPDSDYQ